MAEKQDEERFMEEAGLWLKELRLAGVGVHCPLFLGEMWTSPSSSMKKSWARIHYKEHSLVIGYERYRWYVGAPSSPCQCENFEDAKENIMRRLGFRE
jgi:hypothetical protein